MKKYRLSNICPLAGKVGFCVILIMVFLPNIHSALPQQSADELYEAALLKKEAEGDLNGAIQLFQKIVKSFPESREIGAKALYQIGICYEKMGREEAQKAYQQIINDYADQQKVVADARARLASLASGGPAPGAGIAAEGQAGLTFRKIDFEEVGVSHQARLSPDGRRLLYIGVQEKEPRYSIRVMDLASGKSHSLVEGVDFGANIIFEWSPDGKKVVFKHGRGELRLTDAEGGKPETLWSSDNSETSVFPLDWSEETHTILIALVDRKEQSVRLATLPERGGKPGIIVSGDPNELADLGHFSPDGKFVVGFIKKDNNMEICIWSVDGGKEVRVTNHPADDIYPFWSPDGSHVVFVSDRSKTVDLWAVPMDGPNPAGEPIRIQADIGKGKIPSDLTRSGHLTYYAMSSQGRPSDFFVLNVSLETGEADGMLRPFSKFPTQNSMARWSPDGLRIAYTSRKGNIQLPNIYVSTGGDTEDLEIPSRNYLIGNIEWARDGKHLIFPGWNNDDSRVGIFRISLEERTIEPVQVLGERYGNNFKGAYINIRWLPLMGKYMFGRLLGEDEQEIYTMDPDSYKIELTAEGIKSSGWCLPSPDGRHAICVDFKNKDINLLAFKDMSYTFLCGVPPEGWPAFSWSPDGRRFVWNEENRLKLVSVSAGTTEILVDLDENRKIVGGLDGTPNTAWSPDGSKIAFIVRNITEPAETPDEIWIVDVAGRGIKKIAVAPSGHPQLSGVSWHPSGKMIFSKGNAASGVVRYEHWIMENFLPERKGK